MMNTGKPNDKGKYLLSMWFPLRALSFTPLCLFVLFPEFVFALKLHLLILFNLFNDLRQRNYATNPYKQISEYECRICKQEAKILVSEVF